MTKKLLAVLFAFTALAAQAQTLTSATIKPTEPKVGEKVTVTGEFELNAQKATNCSMRVKFGDGTPEQYFKINQAKDVPLIVDHTYTKAGTYTIEVHPRAKLPMLRCLGDDKNLTVTVAAAAVAAAPAAGPSCPEGWKLDKKSVSKKTGAYTCTAKANTAAPAGKLSCPGTLGYFENTKKGQLGCRP